MTNRSRTISTVEDRCFRALRGLFPSIDSRVDNRRPCDWTLCSIHQRLSRRLQHTERATAHSPQMSMIRRGSRVMCRFSLVRIRFCTVQMQDSARTRVEYTLLACWLDCMRKRVLTCVGGSGRMWVYNSGISSAHAWSFEKRRTLYERASLNTRSHGCCCNRDTRTGA